MMGGPEETDKKMKGSWGGYKWINKLILQMPKSYMGLGLCPGCSTCDPAEDAPNTHVGDQEESPGFPLKISSALLVVTIWGVNPQMEVLRLDNNPSTQTYTQRGIKGLGKTNN